MAYMKGKPLELANHEIQIEQITPLYDNLLVRRVHEEEASLIMAPGVIQTKDGRWLKKTDSGPRRGVVVAAGRGDLNAKSPLAMRYDGPVGWNETARYAMDVQVGDTIIYPRFESSHVMVNGEQLTFVHEADVMAVLDV